jgi:hypothetical protein
MIRVARLLAIDAQHASEKSVKACVGDSYLYAKNPIYRNIRDIFLDLGCQYVNSDTRLWRDYQIWPLMCLRRILTDGVVPYLDNGVMLRRLVEENPEFDIPGPFMIESLRHNYLIHESSHCIAHRVLACREDIGNGAGSNDRFVLDAIIGESFANTAERLAWALADTPTHILFYSINSYMSWHAEHRKIIDAALAAKGVECLFRLALATFLFQNTRPTTPDGATLESFIDLAVRGERLAADERECLNTAVTKSLTLSVVFRKDTTPAYFRLLGCAPEFARLAERPLDAADIESLGLLDTFDHLAQIATKGIPAPAACVAAV